MFLILETELLMETLVPILSAISVFLIYFHVYNTKRNKSKAYEDITNFDLVDETLYDKYLTIEKDDAMEKYEGSVYYKYMRKHTIKFQSYIKDFINLKYLQWLDDLIEQSGRKYNMKAIEFLSLFIMVFVTATVLAKLIFGLSIGVALLAACGVTFLFPINDVIIEPRKKRRKLIKIELPNVLDFFYILMSAGNSFEESLKEIAMNNSTPLADEFKRIMDEIENKKIPSVQAYNNSEKRVGLDSYTNFIKAIQAGQELGANIVDNLKEKSEDLKDELMTDKEKKIESLQGKIIVPIVIFFLPPVVLFFFGPQFYEMFSSFKL